MLADNRLHLNPLLAIKRQAGFICLRLTPWHDVGSNFIDGKQIWLGRATRNQRRKTETNEGKPHFFFAFGARWVSRKWAKSQRGAPSHSKLEASIIHSCGTNNISSNRIVRSQVPLRGLVVNFQCAIWEGWYGHKFRDEDVQNSSFENEANMAQKRATS